MSRVTNYELWKERIDTYRASGLSLANWCQQHNLSKSTLQYWIRKFNKEVASSPIEWGVIPSNASVSESQNHSGIALMFQGIEIKLDQDFDSDTLHKLLQVIKRDA